MTDMNAVELGSAVTARLIALEAENGDLKAENEQLRAELNELKVRWKGQEINPSAVFSGRHVNVR